MSQPNIFVVPERAEAASSARAGGESSAAFADFDKIQVGDEAKFAKVILEADVEAFAKLSGDRNPLHMDAKFAARTHFQRRDRKSVV